MAPSPEPAGDWKPTENPNATVERGQMRSDREEIPGGFTKEEADRAETMEAAKLQSRTTSLTAGCQVYWPSPHEVCGAIKDKYNSMGGPNSYLLWPAQPEYRNPDNVGYRQAFQNGPIYWHPNAGAHPVVNHFFAAWQRNGWEGGVLKYPTTDEIVNPDNFGRRQEFQGGTIYWKANEAYFVTGAIRTKWNQLGPQPAERSFLGYPTSDEIRLPDGAGYMNRFEHGVIYWSPSTGAHPVSGGILTYWALTNYEVGPYGYPISDDRPRGSARDQDFQRGTIGFPTSAVDGDGIDWQEDYINESNCNECGDDSRFANGGPAYLNVSQPPPVTELVPGGGSAEEERREVDPHATLCSELVPDPNASEDAVVWCFDDSTTSDVGEQQRYDWENWTSKLDESYCASLPQRQWAGNRQYQCMWRRDKASFKYTNGGDAGWIDYVVEHQIRPKWNQTTWEVRTVLHVLQATDHGTSSKWETDFSCQASGGSCALAGDWGRQNMPISAGATVMNYTITNTTNGPLPSGAIVTTTSRAGFKFTNPQAVPIQVLNTPKTVMPDVRCDAVDTRAQGCAVRDAEPILDLRNRGVNELAYHVTNAQITGLPGKPGGTPLTRTSNAATVQTNRNATCNRIPGPRAAGIQCDEYPFASTNQGGAGGGPIRTYSVCDVEANKPTRFTIFVGVPVTQNVGSTGTSMCFINGRQNMRGGGITTWFYSKNRVLDGDKFYVRGN